MNSQPALIQLSKVSRRFFLDEMETLALDGIDLIIQSGEFVSIEGPSGCGKSTLLAILGLLDTPTSGVFRLRGTAVDTLSRDDRARIRNTEIGFVFQSFNLIGDLSVQKNVELPLLYRSMAPSERRKRAEECLESKYVPSPETHAWSTVRWATAAGGGGPGIGGLSFNPFG